MSFCLAIFCNRFKKVVDYSCVIIFVLLLPLASATAQYIDHGAIRDQMIQNMILEQRVRIFAEDSGALNAREARITRIEKTGAACIKAGKAF